MTSAPTMQLEDLSKDPLLTSLPRDGNGRPTLGGIPLLRCIGRGGMGSVYFALHPRLQLEVAVKILPPQLAEKDPSLAARFLSEARIAASLASDHLVRVLDVNTEGTTNYLVMEFVDGETAGAGLKRRKAPYPEKEALDVVIAATRGLAVAHDRGIIHRDIKPDNIIIPRGELSRAKLADLGLAKPETGRESVETMPDVAMGTPGYMAPEQAESAKTAGPAADIFATGATLYALLAARPPFAGNSIIATLRDTIEKPHPPLPDTVSPELRALVDRCLAKNPKDRFPTAQALLAALLKLRSPKPSAVPSIPKSERIVYAVGGALALLLATLAIVVFWPRDAAVEPSTSAFEEYWRGADVARTIAQAKDDVAAWNAVADAAKKAETAATTPADAKKAHDLLLEAQRRAAAKAAPPEVRRITLKFAPRTGDILLGRSENMLITKSARNTTTRRDVSTATITFQALHNGRLAKKTIDITEMTTEQKSEKDPRPQRTVGPLQGRKLVLHLLFGRLVIDGAEGLDEKITKNIRLEEDHTFYLPKRAVAIGESWDLDPAEFRSTLIARFNAVEFLEGKALLTLRDVRTIDGRSCAIISTSLELKNKGVALKLAGEMIVWIERGYLLSNKAQGTARLALPGENDVETAMTLEETATIRE